MRTVRVDDARGSEASAPAPARAARYRVSVSGVAGRGVRCLYVAELCGSAVTPTGGWPAERSIDAMLFELTRSRGLLKAHQADHAVATMARLLAPWPGGSRRWPASSSTAIRSSWSFTTRPSTCAIPRTALTKSRTLGLDRKELGAFLVHAGLASPRDHALGSLLALNGLPVSEALAPTSRDLEFEREHRSLDSLLKGTPRALTVSVRRAGGHRPRRCPPTPVMVALLGAVEPTRAPTPEPATNCYPVAPT